MHQFEEPLTLTRSKLEVLTVLIIKIMVVADKEEPVRRVDDEGKKLGIEVLGVSQALKVIAFERKSAEVGSIKFEKVDLDRRYSSYPKNFCTRSI